jgi:hypothetical protein
MVRLYISDPLQYAVAQSVGDGETLEFLFPNAPIYPGSAKIYKNGVLQSAGYSIDEELGLVTFSSPPASGTEIEISAKFTLLTDQNITDILSRYQDSDNPVMLAAADCLDIIASSEALILKRIRNLDLDIDGPAVAESLRAHAKSLRESVRNQEGSSWDFAEQIYDSQGYIEKIIKDEMRQG